MSLLASDGVCAPRVGLSETWIPKGKHVQHLLAAEVGERVRYAAGEYLYGQGDIDRRFFVLLSGKVYVANLSEDGHESTFNIMGPGSVIGEAAAMTALPRYSAARALEDSELLQLNAEDLEDYVRRDPRFTVALIHVLSVKQRLAVDRLHQAVFESPDQRILHLLEQLIETHADSEAGEGDAPLTVHLTHEQIGNLTNLSRVTVTRTLKKLKQDGHIDLLGRAIVVLREGRRRDV